MSLKDQIKIQQMYAQKINSGKNDIEKRDDVIKDLKRKLQNVTKQDIIVKK
jgi:hypothetical protein